MPGCILSLWVVSDSLQPHELYSPPGFTVHEIFQARVLEWIFISYSRGPSWSRDWTWISCIGKQILYHWPPGKPQFPLTEFVNFVNLLIFSEGKRGWGKVSAKGLATDLLGWREKIYHSALLSRSGHEEEISENWTRSNICNFLWKYFLTFKKFISFNWRLITLQYCSGFCHTLTSAMCVHVSPHPKPPFHFPPHPIILGCPSSTGFECPVSCKELGLVIYFTYGNMHVSLLFSQIIPLSPSPPEYKSLSYISVSLLLSCT